MMNIKRITLGMIAVAILASCSQQHSLQQPEKISGKPVIYQVFTRLFGNTNTTNNPWGTIQENGVGKFNDFDDKALSGIKELGVSHIWFTGVLHHALINDYTTYGISNDDPDVVKGRAGSPYAIKDYYNVNPDLAVNPAKRLGEFKALINRTHKHGMKVVIDIVPNHIARNYHSPSKPTGIVDFGTNDNTDLAYDVNNNFYYVPGQNFKVPTPDNNYQALGGDKHPLLDGKFSEIPAKWTGNGSRKAQPHFYDWFETVKINYGVRPDGSHDFASLPAEYANKAYTEHYSFWQQQKVPDSWTKFRDIALFWLEQGIDGFRYDMAEMVPVEFWSYLNSHIKMQNPQAFILAEVYNPQLYRDYIKLGQLDYLYDKVGFYDTLKRIMQGKGSTDDLIAVQKQVTDIAPNLLHFLENHDEQRIASPQFAGNAQKGMPAMVVSATISQSPTMLYFGQSVGEDGSEDGGFGKPSRTSIFDYVGVPAHQRWMNNGKFDGGQLTPQEKQLRTFYTKLMSFVASSPALSGSYQEIHSYNRQFNEKYNEQIISYVRWNKDDKLIVVSNFDPHKSQQFQLLLPDDIISQWQLTNTRYELTDQLTKQRYLLQIRDGVGSIQVTLPPLGSLLLAPNKGL